MRAETGRWRERQLALMALARGDHPRARTLVEQMALASDPVMRAVAARAAGELEDRRILARLVRDTDPGVRLAALSTALQLQGPEAASLARDGLLDPDHYVRTAVLEWLADHPMLPVETLLAPWPTDPAPVYDPARALATALAARAEAESGERGVAVSALLDLALAPERLIRRAAANALERLGAPRPEIGPRRTTMTLTDYRHVIRRTRRPLRAEIVTTRGRVVLRLACRRAPLTCLNFVHLAEQGYFDGLTFHRVVPDFVIQGGDPLGTGWGGPGYTIRDEINRIPYERGVVGMALAGPDTGGSQFFITLAAQPHLDGTYTVFGEVVEGEEVLNGIVQGDEMQRVRIVDGL